MFEKNESFNLFFPKEIQIDCLIYLSYIDLWNLYKVYPEIFLQNYNYYWNYIFEKNITIPRKIGANSWGIAYIKYKI